jgi:general secretion pathway protein G
MKQANLSISMDKSMLRKHPRARGARGAFTLIELLLVMVIIVIMAGMVVVKYTGYIQGTRIKAAKGDIAQLKTALTLFESENGRFPTTEEGIRILVENPGNLPGWHKYLDRSSVPADPWGHPYIYRCPASDASDDYDLLSAGPDGQPGTADDIKPD